MECVRKHGQIGTGQNISLCKHLGEDAVCVPMSVMSNIIEKINVLTETVSKTKGRLARHGSTTEARTESQREPPS